MDDQEYRHTVFATFAEYPQIIGTWSVALRLMFYERVALQLTVAIRGIAFEEFGNDTTNVEQIKWLNEALHRVLHHISSLRQNTQYMTEDEMTVMLHTYAEKNGAVKWYMAQAVVHALAHMDAQS